MINKRRLIKTFIDLVKLDSLSLREQKAAEYLRKYLKRYHLRLRELGRPPGGEIGNLACHLPGRGPRLLLNAHIDTVSPGKGIRPTKRGRYIRSDGTTILGADNKAGVAAILEIIAILIEKNIPHPPLDILFTVAEEIGLIGAKAISQDELKADYGLVLDGGDINKIINQAPTQDNLFVTIVGKAAHAGIHPEEGINAIKVASAAIAKMKLGRIDQETTANIGLIRGGKATNIIPEEVELKGEARSHNLIKLKKQVAQMKNLLQASSRQAGAKCRIQVERMYNSFRIEPEHQLVARVAKAMRQENIKPQITKTGGGSDANIFNELGIPSIILGVGADHVHTKKEQILMSDLVAGTKIVLA